MDGDRFAIASIGLEVNGVLGAVGEGVNVEFTLVGGDGASELCLVQVEAEIGSGDLAFAGDLEAAKGQATAVDPEVVIAIYRQAVVIVVVAAEVERDGIGGVALVLVKEEADVAVA